MVILTANISIPPNIPFILFASFYTGALVFQKDFLMRFSTNISFEIIKQDLFQYVTGAIVLAVVTGLFAGLISYLLMCFFRKNKKQDFV